MRWWWWGRGRHVWRLVSTQWRAQTKFWNVRSSCHAHWKYQWFRWEEALFSLGLWFGGASPGKESTFEEQMSGLQRNTPAGEWTRRVGTDGKFMPTGADSQSRLRWKLSLTWSPTSRGRFSCTESVFLCVTHRETIVRASYVTYLRQIKNRKDVVCSGYTQMDAASSRCVFHVLEIWAGHGITWQQFAGVNCHTVSWGHNPHHS